MGNCCVTPPGIPDHEKKKHKKKQNPFALDFGHHNGGTNHKLIVLRDPTGKEIEQRYELGRELGRGEFGITYLCTDRETGENFACKSISKKKLRTAVDIEDVRREVEIMKHMPQHPNLVTLKDTYEDDSAVHLVMELCEGGELFDRIVARGHYTERAAAAVTKTIVEVVQICHEYGVMHRDLKPENFLFGILEAQTLSAVEELKSAVSFQGKGAMQKLVGALREMRRLLSKSEFPPVEAAIKAGAIPLLVQCLSFGSPDEQLLEAAWCLTNIAAGKPEETKALLPALPLLIAHLGEKSSVPVAEQCAWALGNVAGEGEELRSVLLCQGALPPLARMMLPNKGSTVRTAAWALSNLIKGPDHKAATELIRVDGVLDAILRHLRKADEELATEVAWVVVYLSALSNVATSMLVKSDALQLLVQRLASSNSLQLLIPVLRSLGNVIAGDSHTIVAVLLPGCEITDNVIEVLVKCLKSEHRVLKKEAAWVLSNIAAGSIEHKQLIYSSEAAPLLLRLLSTAPFDIRKEVAYVLGNLCVAPTEGDGKPNLISEHLVSLVGRGCLPGFIDLVRSADTEAARLGLQFMELVLRGMPNGEGPKLVEREDGIDAMERFQFHENEDLRNLANALVDRYFGEDYGLDE